MLQRALAQERRNKDAKFKPDRLSMHVLQGESSYDEGNEVYAAEFVWSSNDKPSTCASLKPIPKNRHCRGVANHSGVAECTRLRPEGEYSGDS